jgi:hypothetical protein
VISELLILKNAVLFINYLSRFLSNKWDFNGMSTSMLCFIMNFLIFFNRIRLSPLAMIYEFFQDWNPYNQVHLSMNNLIIFPFFSSMFISAMTQVKIWVSLSPFISYQHNPAHLVELDTILRGILMKNWILCTKYFNWRVKFQQGVTKQILDGCWWIICGFRNFKLACVLLLYLWLWMQAESVFWMVS